MNIRTFSRTLSCIKSIITVISLADLDSRVRALEEISERIDKMRDLAGKKLDSVYQFIMASKRKRKMEATLAARAAASDPIPKKDEVVPKEERRRRRLRSRMYALPKFYDGKLDLDRKLSMSQSNTVEFGHIPDNERQFYTLHDPRVRA